MEPFIHDNIVVKGAAHGRRILKKLVRDSIKEIEIQRQTLFDDEESDEENSGNNATRQKTGKEVAANQGNKKQEELSHTIDISDVKTFRVENAGGPSGSVIERDIPIKNGD